jgi:hypothetical protein
MEVEKYSDIMKKEEFNLTNFLTIEDEIGDDNPTVHIWLPKEDAQNVAINLVKQNVPFSFLPEPDDENTVEIETGCVYLDKCIKFNYEIIEK